MWRRTKRQDGNAELVTATEIASFVYCREAWRPQHGLGLEPANRAALDAGLQHHERKAAAELVAGGSIGIGQALVVVAMVVILVLLWVVWR